MLQEVSFAEVVVSILLSVKIIISKSILYLSTAVVKIKGENEKTNLEPPSLLSWEAESLLVIIGQFTNDRVASNRRQKEQTKNSLVVLRKQLKSCCCHNYCY